MASPSQKSYRLKFARGCEQLNELDRQRLAYLQRNPYGMEGETDPVTGEHVIRGRLSENVPPVLTLIMGDGLHNLRASLDHLAYALAVANKGGKPANEGVIQFPICSTLESFQDKKTQRCIAELASAARDAIERLQPYHGGPTIGSFHPLALLREFSNVDKHRYTHLVGFSGPLPEVTIEHLEAGVRQGYIKKGPAYDPGFFEADAVVVRVAANTKYNVEVKKLYDVAFDRDGPAAGILLKEALPAIRGHILDTVFPTLEPLLP